MFYRSYADLAHDMKAWAVTLPPFAAVCGVPRSGIIPATMLALHRNLQVVSLDGLARGERPWETPLRRACPAARGPVLVVDDTVNTGDRMRAVKTQLPAGLDVRFAAYVAGGPGVGEIDFWYYDVGDEPHLFEWCGLQHWWNDRTLTDLDGVLCPDWPHEGEDGPLADAYRRHLDDSPPLLRPSFKLMGVVTARLEKHRDRTEAWLRRHGIEFGSLAMSPHATPDERRRHDGFVGHKARAYAASPAAFFVESDPGQAREIARRTGKPVLDWKNQIVIPCFEPGVGRASAERSDP